MVVNPYQPPGVQSPSILVYSGPNSTVTTVVLSLNSLSILLVSALCASFVVPELAVESVSTYLVRGHLVVAQIAYFAFVFWFYKAHKNLSNFGELNLENTHAKAVWGFFVPFANLIIPYGVMREIWTRTSVDREPAPFFIPLWWGFSVVNFLWAIVSAIVFKSAIQDGEAIPVLAGNGLLIARDVTTVLIVHLVMAAQSRRARSQSLPAAGTA